MEQVNLTVIKREARGKGPVRRLRAQGLVPGVVYGMGRDPIPVQVGERQMSALLSGHHGTNVLLSLEIEDCPIEGSSLALLKTLERHPVTRAPESVDFQWLDADKPIALDVPLVLEGEAPGVKMDGIVEQVMMELHISCLPAAIPESIVVDIGSLELGEAIHVRDVQLPEGIQLLTNEGDVVVTCAVPRLVVEEVPEEAAALEEGAEEAEGEEGEERPEAAEAKESGEES